MEMRDDIRAQRSVVDTVAQIAALISHAVNPAVPLGASHGPISALSDLPCAVTLGTTHDD